MQKIRQEADNVAAMQVSAPTMMQHIQINLGGHFTYDKTNQSYRYKGAPMTMPELLAKANAVAKRRGSYIFPVPGYWQ